MSPPPSRDTSEPPQAPAARPEADAASLDALRDRLGASDADAFEQVFRRLSSPVFRFVRGMVSSDALAHDLTQDTFVRLWNVRDRMPSVDSLRAYVFQIARNRVYNHQRNEQTRRDHQDQWTADQQHAPPPSPDASLDADLLRALLDRWIDDLPARQREALLLRRREHLSHEEIADAMDIAPSTVNNHIVRALKALRTRLRKHRPDLLD